MRIILGNKPLYKVLFRITLGDKPHLYSNQAWIKYPCLVVLLLLSSSFSVAKGSIRIFFDLSAFWNTLMTKPELSVPVLLFCCRCQAVHPGWFIPSCGCCITTVLLNMANLCAWYLLSLICWIFTTISEDWFFSTGRPVRSVAMLPQQMMWWAHLARCFSFKIHY